MDSNSKRQVDNQSGSNQKKKDSQDSPKAAVTQVKKACIQYFKNYNQSLQNLNNANLKFCLLLLVLPIISPTIIYFNIPTTDSSTSSLLTRMVIRALCCLTYFVLGKFFGFYKQIEYIHCLHFIMIAITLITSGSFLDQFSSPDALSYNTNLRSESLKTDFITIYITLSIMFSRFILESYQIMVIVGETIIFQGLALYCSITLGVDDSVIYTFFICVIGLLFYSGVLTWRKRIVLQEQQKMDKLIQQEILSMELENAQQKQFFIKQQQVKETTRRHSLTHSVGEKLLMKLRHYKFELSLQKNNFKKSGGGEDENALISSPLSQQEEKKQKSQREIEVKVKNFVEKQKSQQMPPLQVSASLQGNKEFNAQKSPIQKPDKFDSFDAKRDKSKLLQQQLSTIQQQQQQQQGDKSKKKLSYVVHTNSVLDLFQRDKAEKSHSVQVSNQSLEGDSGEDPEDCNNALFTMKDVDSLIQSVISSKGRQWIPNILYEKISEESDQIEQNIDMQAKEFILNHFTEKEIPLASNIQNISVDQNQNKLLEKSMPENIQMKKHLHSITDSFDFDVFMFQELTQGKALQELGFSMYKKFNVPTVLKIDNLTVLSEFLNAIDNAYLKNPYHNSLHAIDVTNTISYFLTCGTNLFNQFEQVCLLISALAHDVGHLGVNNSYLVETHHKQAMIYNDRSVLENMHCAILFQILSDQATNILKNLSKEEFKSFRKCCITLILNSDLQKHFSIVNKFKNMLALDQSDVQEESLDIQALSIFLKCADVSHGAKTLSLHKTWSRRILEEFFNQGELELKNNLAITPLCDRTKKLAKSQEGFLKVIVFPLYEAMFEFLEAKNDQKGQKKVQSMKKLCLDHIKENIDYWQNMEENDNEDCEFLKSTEYVKELINSEKQNKGKLE